MQTSSKHHLAPLCTVSHVLQCAALSLLVYKMKSFEDISVIFTTLHRHCSCLQVHMTNFVLIAVQESLCEAFHWQFFLQSIQLHSRQTALDAPSLIFSSLCSSLQSPVMSSSSGPNIILNTLFLNTLKPTFFPECQRPCVIPYKCVSIFVFYLYNKNQQDALFTFNLFQ